MIKVLLTFSKPYPDDCLIFAERLASTVDELMYQIFDLSLDVGFRRKLKEEAGELERAD